MTDSLRSSWGSLAAADSGPPRSRRPYEEFSDIRLALDLVLTRLVAQQDSASRRLEHSTRTVYDSVIDDLNEVRKQVNGICDTVDDSGKYKYWVPVAPFRKTVLKSAYEISRPARILRGSRSVDTLDSKTCNTSTSSIQKGVGLLSDRTRSSSSTISMRGSSESVPRVTGYGCCFNGDNKTVPHRSYRAQYEYYRDPAFRWSSSKCRSRSRSPLSNDDNTDLNIDKGCMCGPVPEDWRARVAPYMWDGWDIPGLQPVDLQKLRERFEKFERFRQETVDVHNEYRRLHGCPELSVSDELSRDAMGWAWHLAAKGYTQYSESPTCGENILAVDVGGELSGRQVVDTWYREHRRYRHRRPGWQRGTSNFTQMIWKDSRHIGVGIAKYPSQDTYIIVVRYQPPGNRNTPAEFRINVPPPLVDTSMSDVTGEKEHVEKIVAVGDAADEELQRQRNTITSRNTDETNGHVSEASGAPNDYNGNTSVDNHACRETNVKSDKPYTEVHLKEIKTSAPFGCLQLTNDPSITKTHEADNRIGTEDNADTFQKILPSSNVRATESTSYKNAIQTVNGHDAVPSKLTVTEEYPYATIADIVCKDRPYQISESANAVETADTNITAFQHGQRNGAGLQNDHSAMRSEITAVKDDVYASVVKPKVSQLYEVGHNASQSLTSVDTLIDGDGYATIPVQRIHVSRSISYDNGQYSTARRQPLTATHTKRRASIETDV